MSEQTEVNNEQVEEVKEEHVEEVKEKQQKLSYFQYVQQIFKNPSDIFIQDFKGYDLYGIINLIALAVLLFGSIFVQRVIMFSGTAWFSWGFSGAVRQSIAYMVPLAIVLFLFHWYATKEGNKQKISFFFEKVGAALLIPCVFLLLSIPFNLLDITIHSWFRSMGITFIYIGVFMVSYMFVSRNNLQVAAIFLMGYFFTFRLINLIL